MDLPQYLATHKLGRLCGRCDNAIQDDNTSGICQSCLNEIHFLAGIWYGYMEERQGDIKIIIDTREQLPLKFKDKHITEVIKRKLDVGDYGCVFENGHEVNIYFDRKSIGDLYGTMGKGYARFKKSMLRSKESGSTLFIIVEDSMSRVGEGFSRSSIQGISMLYKLFTIWVKYGVQTIYCKDRKEMSDYITNFYIACGKEYVRKQKES